MLKTYQLAEAMYTTDPICVYLDALAKTSLDKRRRGHEEKHVCRNREDGLLEKQREIKSVTAIRASPGAKSAIGAGSEFVFWFCHSV